MNEALGYRGVSRWFGTLQALERVELGFQRGEIHALLGENGAGKTTLVNLALGLLAPDAGEVHVDGQAQRITSPARARKLGIGMVHQHCMLVDAFTVAENLALLSAPTWYTAGQLADRARALLPQRGRSLPLDVEVGTLSIGEKQHLEIRKALHHARSVLILDEPTAVLTPREVEVLFAELRDLARSGLAVVLITHKIPEVFAVADRVSVLHQGRVVASGPVRTFTVGSLTQALLGAGPEPPAAVSRVSGSEAAALAPNRETLLEIENLVGTGCGPVSLHVQRGEILGIAGVAGNGQTALAETIVGLRERLGGRWWCRGKGLGFISGDRRNTGLALELSVAENTLLKRAALPRRLLRKGEVHKRAAALLEPYQVRLQTLAQPVGELSGGNQQKVVLARELAGRPDVIVAENPTRGLDLSATDFVQQKLRKAAHGGAAVLLFSTDVDEIVALSNRVLVARRGLLYPSPRERAEIGQRMLGAVPEPAAAPPTTGD